MAKVGVRVGVLMIVEVGKTGVGIWVIVGIGKLGAGVLVVVEVGIIDVVSDGSDVNVERRGAQLVIKYVTIRIICLQ